MEEYLNRLKLSSPKKWLLLIVSFLLVAFGQPVWSEWLGILASICGFSLFWRALLDIPNVKERFLLSMGWYSGVQFVQLSWFLSHPFYYIYGVALFCAMLMGAQWGILSIWIKPETFRRYSPIFALAGLWTLFEWSRLFILSGLPFNPVGLTLTGLIYPMQGASLGGMYGLSFFVILSNLLILRAWIYPYSLSKWTVAAFVVLLPYIYGWSHLAIHERGPSKHAKTIKVLLVQSALPIEEKMHFESAMMRAKRSFQVWSTLKKPISAPRCRGSRAISSKVSALASIRRL